MKTICKKGVALIAALICVLSFATPALAYSRIDLSMETSLTLSYGSPEAIADAQFDLYRVADVSEQAEFTLSGAFADYAVNLKDLNSEGFRAAAETLAGYAQRDQAPKAAQGQTDGAGKLVFDKLDVGLYLVVGQPLTLDEHTYLPEPMLVVLPGLDADRQWEYHRSVAVKYEDKEKPPEPGDETVTRKVYKIWKDGGQEEKRPEKITVQLLQNGSVYDTVTLNEENNWKYTWTDLDAKQVWTVVERDIPKGYTVSVEREGMSFLMTNEYDLPDKPDKPDEPKLPQTGVLWWPVPLLSLTGLLLFLIGWMRHRKADGQEE